MPLQLPVLDDRTFEQRPDERMDAASAAVSGPKRASAAGRLATLQLEG